MSNLRDRRNASLLNRAMRRLARRGKYPRFSAVFDMLAALAGRSAEGSTLDPVRFVRGEHFPLDDFNKNLEDIAQEFQILFDESVFRASKIVESQVIVEEFVGEIRRQLRKIRENTQRELLLAASNFLDAIVIKFVNRDLIDQDITTVDIDTNSGLVTLPKRAGARRVIPPVIPASPLELESPDDDVRVILGSEFSSIFTDALANWQVLTMSNNIRVRFSLGGPLKIGRIQVATPDDQARLEVRISPDGLNFIRVGEAQNIEGGLADYLFESQDVRFIEFVMTKTVAPESNGNVFTIDTFSFFTVGYQTSAILQTTALATETGSNIKRATIDLDADIPAQTSVELEVAGGITDFRKVENRIISFTDSKKNSVQRRADSANILLRSFSTILGSRGFTTGASPNSGLNINDVWGVAEATFFGTTAIPTNIDSRYTKLYRENNWGVEAKVTNETRTATSHMSLGFGERADMYIQISDDLYENGAALGTTIDVANDIANGDNMPLSGSEDARIIKATGTFNHGRFPRPSVGPFPEFSVIIHVEQNGPDKIVYTEDNIAGTPLYVADYQSLQIEGIGDVAILAFDPVSLSRRIDLDPTVDITPGTYTVKLTHRDLPITAINGRTIVFGVTLREFEKVTLTYNTPIDGVNNVLVASSVVVRSGRDSSVVGTAGLDYRIIGNSIEMMTTTSLPTDGQGAASSARVPVDVTFDYISKKPNFFSYWTYVVVPEGVSKIIKITPIVLERDEKVIWTDPSGKAVDMEGLNTLVLASGIHRFSVIGIRGLTDDNALDPASALFKLVNLAGVDSGFVFDPNAQYIERLTGYIEPMNITNRFFLERGAKKNNVTQFAWEDGHVMAVLKLDGPSDTVTIEPGNNIAIDGADYRLEYRYYESNGVDSMKIRATLRRDPSTDPSKTPVIRGMTVRFTE